MDRFRLVDRRTLLRLGPPVAFLLAATVAVLLVRSALHHNRNHSTTPATTYRRTIPVARAPTKPTASTASRSYYRIQGGDTLSSVALKFNTTIEELQALNPGVDPHALTVGQRVRVR